MKRFKRITGLLLLAMSLSPINVLASGFKDVANHWARDALTMPLKRAMPLAMKIILLNPMERLLGLSLFPF